MARSKLENALYESFVKGETPRFKKPQVANVGMNSSVQIANRRDDGGAAQLVKALSGISSTLAETSDRLLTDKITTETAQAEKDYLGLTLEQRKAKIQSGELNTKDPLYSGVFSHLWGEDAARSTREEIVSQIQTGQLKFKTPDELEKYMLERRDHDLTNYNGNEFALTGYDKQFNLMRHEAQRLNSTMRNKEERDQAIMGVRNKFLGSVKDGATPEELQRSFGILQHAGNFTDIEMHQQLAEVAQTLSRQGKTAQLEKLLGTQFSADKEFGTLGSYLGDNSEALIKNAKGENEKQRREAFEGTYASLLQSATEGKLNSFIGGRRADVASVYAYLDKNGVKDVYSPEQVAGLVNHHNNALERQRAEAERNLARQQRASMQAQMQALAANQAHQFGRAGVTDQVYTDSNGVTHVVSADTLFKKEAANYTGKLDKLVADKQLTPEQAFAKKREFFARGGGVNEQWKDTLTFGVESAAQILANPNDKGARTNFDNALRLYGDLKGSATPWLADTHVSGKSKDVLNLALMAQARGQDPAMVVANAMNSVEERKVTYKDVSKVVKDDRLAGQVMDTAEMYARGLKMPIKDAIAKAKEDLTNYYPKVNGVAVPPITRNITPDKQEAALNSIVGRVAKEVSHDPANITLDTFNQASGFYTMRYKNGFAPVLGKNNQPIVISKDELYKEVGALEEAALVKASGKALEGDRGAGFKRGKPIDLSSHSGLENVTLPSIDIPSTNFNDVVAPNIGVPRNKR